MKLNSLFVFSCGQVVPNTMTHHYNFMSASQSVLANSLLAPVNGNIPSSSHLTESVGDGPLGKSAGEKVLTASSSPHTPSKVG